jgi:hypothetical protein
MTGTGASIKNIAHKPTLGYFSWPVARKETDARHSPMSIIYVAAKMPLSPVRNVNDFNSPGKLLDG